MKYTLKNHIIGKVYDLTQENMNEMIIDIEMLRDMNAMALVAIRVEYDDYYRNLDETMVCDGYTECISELSKVLDICNKLLGGKV